MNAKKETEMPNMNDMFPSKTLKADDLKAPSGKGYREFSLTVDHLETEDFKNEDGTTEKKWLVYFKGAQKALVLNRTNAGTISDAYGDDTDSWTGEKVVLYVTTVGTPQGPKPGIRVRIPSTETFDPEKVDVPA